jgi:hypothetical protein
MKVDIKALTEAAIARGKTNAIDDVYVIHKWLNLPFILAEAKKGFRTEPTSAELPDFGVWVDKLVNRDDYRKVGQEMKRIEAALHQMVEMPHMAFYGMVIIRRLMRVFAMKDSNEKVAKLYMEHESLASEDLHEALRLAARQFIGQSQSGVKMPMSTSHALYFSSHFNPYHQFIAEALIKAQPEQARLFLMLRRYSKGHEKLKRLVDWALGLRFAVKPTAPRLIALYRQLDSAYTPSTIAEDILPKLGALKGYDSKLAQALTKNTSSLDLIETKGIGLKAFVTQQLRGLDRNITTQENGYSAFLWVMLECARRDPEIDRAFMAERLLPRFHTAFSFQPSFVELCQKAMKLLPLSRNDELELTAYMVAAQDTPCAPANAIPVNALEQAICYEALGRVRHAGMRLKPAKMVASLLSLKMYDVLEHNPQLKRKAIEEDLAL